MKCLEQTNTLVQRNVKKTHKDNYNVDISVN